MAGINVDGTDTWWMLDQVSAGVGYLHQQVMVVATHKLVTTLLLLAI